MLANWRLTLDKLEPRMIVKDYLDDKNVEYSKFKNNFREYIGRIVLLKDNLTQGFADRVKVTVYNDFAYLTVLF